MFPRTAGDDRAVVRITDFLF